MIVAGENATFTCYSSYSKPYWHFYSLASDSQPCGFDSDSYYQGNAACLSIPRISVEYSLSYPNNANLTISTAQLSDAGTYTCGGRSPYDLSRTVSVIVGVIGKTYIVVLYWIQAANQSTSTNINVTIQRKAARISKQVEHVYYRLAHAHNKMSHYSMQPIALR